MIHAQACWLAEPGRAELRTETLPAPGPGELRVRALHSGISRGTETLVFRGEVPSSEFERMRAPFQQGAFPAPVKCTLRKSHRAGFVRRMVLSLMMCSRMLPGR